MARNMLTFTATLLVAFFGCVNGFNQMYQKILILIVRNYQGHTEGRKMPQASKLKIRSQPR